MKNLLLISMILSALFSSATVFTVTNTNDSGAGSLRQAIDYANGLSGTHTIEFNIPTSDGGYNSSLGVWEFNPATTYNYIIRDNLTIDGTSQTTNQGDLNPFGPEIVLNGNDNDIDYCFSIINASGVTIKGFCIIEFSIGVQIFGDESTGCFIIGNYVGITAVSDTVAGNNIGIEIIGGPYLNYVGGSNEEDRNIVSGNEHIGIRIVDANQNAVFGNYVGLDRTGTLAMPNYDGVSIEGSASNNSVGGILPGQRNIVSGNYAYGVPVFGGVGVD